MDMNELKMMGYSYRGYSPLKNKWVYGTFIYPHKLYNESGSSTKVKLSRWVGKEFVEEVVSIPSLGRSTGIPEKAKVVKVCGFLNKIVRGNTIYEGDILEDSMSRLVVIWSEMEGGFYLKHLNFKKEMEAYADANCLIPWSGRLNAVIGGNYNIVGNIYEV